MRIGEDRPSISAFVWKRDGTPHGYGAVETLDVEGTLLVLTVALDPNDTFRFLLVNHTRPPCVVEQLGRVVWTRHAFNPHEELVAESRVLWVAAGEAGEASQEAADEEGAA